MDNRANILHVANQLFAAHGYDAVGVQQIVSQAGVTKPTLYHYFQSKKGLFDALVEEKSAPLIENLRQASHYTGDITASITNVTRCYFDYQEDEPAFYRLMLSTWFMPGSSEIFDTISRLQQAQSERLEAMFLAAEDDHGNMRGRHRRYAVSLRGTIDTYIGLSLRGYIQLDRDDIVYAVVHQFMHGIFS